MEPETLTKIILLYVCSCQSPKVRAHLHPFGENEDVISGGGCVGKRGRHETDRAGTQKRGELERREGWRKVGIFREHDARKLRPNVFPA